MCVHIYLSYLKPKWVEAGVCPAANWAISFNLHGIQQVLIMETGRPVDLKLSLPNAAGTRVMELHTERGSRKKANDCQVLLSSVLLAGLKWLRL